MPNRKTRKDGNVAVAEVDIPELKSEFVAHSQISSSSDKGSGMFDFSLLKPQTEQQFKSYISVDGYVRNVDSEAKILEDIASRIIDPNIQGTIDLYTERPRCPRLYCSGVSRNVSENHYICI